MPLYKLTRAAVTSRVVITDVSGEVLAESLSRAGAVICNDGNEVVYLGLGDDAVAGEGIRLNPLGGAYEITLNNLFLGSVTAVCAAGKTSVVSILQL